MRLHFGDAAKYVTEPISPDLPHSSHQKWYGSLPRDLQEIVDRDGAAASTALNPVALAIYAEQRKAWVNGGGELISLAPDEQSAMMATLASVGADIANQAGITRGLPNSDRRSAAHAIVFEDLMKVSRISIVGGGIRGLSAALVLQHFGYRVAVFEQARELRGGSGVTITPNAMHALNFLGVGDRIAQEPRLTRRT